MNTASVTVAKAGLLGEPVEVTIPTGAALTQESAERITFTNSAANRAFSWDVHWLSHDHATGVGERKQENVSHYIQRYRHGNCPSWVQCLESRNPGGDNSQPQYVAEWDLCHDGTNDYSFGGGLYYGAQTDTFGAGQKTQAGVGWRIWPFVFGRNAIRHAVSAEGEMTEGALAVGMHGDSTTRHAVNMGPGVTLKWSSGTGKAHASAWHSLPREFSVEDFPVVGLIDVEVDGTTLQIPAFKKTV